MDFTQGILAANKPIGEFDPIGSLQESQKNIAGITRENISNEKSRYELDLTYKLQDAINNSLDASGNPDFDKLAVEGKKRGIAPSVIAYAIQTLPSQWKALQETAQAKRGLAVASPEASSAVQGALASPATTQAQPAPQGAVSPSGAQVAPATPDTSWRNRPAGMKQESSTSVARPVLSEPVTPEAPVESKNIFGIMNKTEVKSPFNKAAGGSAGTNMPTVIEGVSDYTLPVAGRTIDGKFTPYTEAELKADPQLNTALAAENYFRTRTGNNTSDPNSVARSYLTSVYKATLESEGAPEPPMPPVDPSPEAMDKYNAAVVAWTNENARAIGKAKAAVTQVKEAVGKGQFELADKLVQNQGSKVKVGDTEYRAYSPKAREGVAALESLKPVMRVLEASLAKVGENEYSSLKLLVPQVARVMAMSMNPGSDVSMGSIAEAEASTQLQGLEAQGLSIGDAITVFSSWASQIGEEGKKKSLFEIAKEYGKDKLDAASSKNLAEKMKELLDHAQQAGEAYRKANLIGYVDSRSSSGDDERAKKAEAELAKLRAELEELRSKGSSTPTPAPAPVPEPASSDWRKGKAGEKRGKQGKKAEQPRKETAAERLERLRRAKK